MATTGERETRGGQTAETTTGRSADADGESSDTGSEEAVEDLPKDVIFGLLTSARRRGVLNYLREHDGESTRGDLAEHIAAEENGIDRSQLSSQQRKRVYISLHQVHLPKMADAGVIDYDENRGAVTLNAEAEQLFGPLDLEPSEVDPHTGGVKSGAIDRLRAVCSRAVQLLSPTDRAE